MKLIIFSVFLIAVMIEIVFAGEKIRSGIGPKAKILFRIMVGLLCNLIYIFIEVPQLFEYLVNNRPVFMIIPHHIEALAWLNVFLVFGYWNLFDGGLNLYRGKNWFIWGKTKKIDRFFGHTFKGWLGGAMLGVGHMLKWIGTIGSAVEFFVPYAY